MLLTISNLYPRPDEHDRGLFNLQFFHHLSRTLAKRTGEDHGIENICLVPTWKPWLRADVRTWQSPVASSHPTRYIPTSYLPVVGRTIGASLYTRSLLAQAPDMKRYSAILATWLYPDVVAAAQLAAQAELPLFVKLHGGDIRHMQHPVKRRTILAACARATGILCVSHPLREHLIQAGLDPSRIHVVPNGVNHSVFSPDTVPLAADQLATMYPEDRPPPQPGSTVLFIGHLVPIKGPDRLINAWHTLIQDHTHNTGARPTLIIIGTGPMRRQLERRVQKLGLTDSVIFAGVRPHSEIAQWMRTAHCLCLPSRGEGMPNVVLESLACGTPVVASDVGEVPFLVDNGTNGHTVKSDDDDFPHRLATALDNTLSHTWDTTLISSTVANYTWKKSAQIAADLMG